jgi:hypothetical protein
MNGGHKSLRVFELAYELSMEIFHLSKSFPKEEKYSLTDQMLGTMIRNPEKFLPRAGGSATANRQPPTADS